MVMILFLLFLISCSDPFESKTSDLKLQTEEFSDFLSHSSVSRELSLRDTVDLSLLLNILSPFFKNPQKSEFVIRAYENPFHSTSLPLEERAVSNAYYGGVYDPVNHQVVFVPTAQGNRSAWHRYDCATRKIEAYENPFHSTSIPEDHRVVGVWAYQGGVYDPVNNQIVFVPASQAPQSIWHRYDCANRKIEAYSNPFHAASLPQENRVVSSYFGGVYDPVNSQIVFVPTGQASRPTWHRYDCVTRTIEAYANPFHSTSLPEDERAVGNAYYGGVYDPVNSQIVFVPHNQSPTAAWHRYDCASKTIEVYENPFHSTSTVEENRVVAGAYFGGVYDPMNNQIVFVPHNQASAMTWHRYDCANRAIEVYENPFHSTSLPENHRFVGSAYFGGVYNPVNNQIIFAPRRQARESIWHRYDCENRIIEPYANPFHSTSMSVEHRAVEWAYHGGVYDSVNNQIIFAPTIQAARPIWHALQNYGTPRLSKQFAAHYLFNKF
jgi:hypothetical protein